MTSKVPKDDRRAQTYETILRVVMKLLESEGDEAVQVRTVAKRARVSLTTLYKLFPTLDDLVLAAIARWMETNGYAGLSNPPTHASLYDGLMWVHRQIFEPWERNPRMLRVYHRARSGPGGEQLDLQGMKKVEPVARAFLEGLDPAYAEDIAHAMTYLICGSIYRFSIGEIGVTDILPAIGRTLYRLTTDNAALAASARPGRRNQRRRKRATSR